MKRVILAGVALAAVAALSGCATIEEYAFHEKELAYATWDDAPTRGDLAFVPAAFVAHDATDLRIRTKTDGTGKLYRYETPTELDPELCAQSAIEKTTALDASWWPESTPTEGWMCGEDWQVFESEGVTYAFRN